MICHILDSCNKELEKEPHNVEILRTRGIAYSIAKKYMQAIDDLLQVINALPSDASSYYLKSDCHFQLGEFEKAKEDYVRATLLERDPAIERGKIENVTVSDETELADIKTILDYEWEKAVRRVFPNIFDEVS